jgi:hypothetical protein
MARANPGLAASQEQLFAYFAAAGTPPEAGDQYVAQVESQCPDRVGDTSLCAQDCRGDVILGNGRHLAFDGFFLPPPGLSAVSHSAIKNP